MNTFRFHQRGFGAIMAMVILVVLASLAAGLVAFNTTEQLDSAQDVLSTRAYAATRAGLEVGLYKALSSSTPTDAWKTCNGSALFLDLSASTGFHVSVTCNSTQTPYNEGETAPGVPATVRVFTITATACNSSSACPDATLATSPGYVERQRQMTATN